jgi:hypothetical protein
VRLGFFSAFGVLLCFLFFLVGCPTPFLVLFLRLLSLTAPVVLVLFVSLAPCLVSLVGFRFGGCRFGFASLFGPTLLATGSRRACGLGIRVAFG